MDCEHRCICELLPGSYIILCVLMVLFSVSFSLYNLTQMAEGPYTNTPSTDFLCLVAFSINIAVAILAILPGWFVNWWVSCPISRDTYHSPRPTLWEGIRAFFSSRSLPAS
jgi:hypothetical protein